MSVIKLRNISKIYGLGDATTVAVDDVDLTIKKGEFVAIMGPSGSGKSTLMNIIGLLDTPSHGDYILDSKPASRLSSNARAKIRRDKIGFVFQSFNLLPRMRVIENVALPLMYSGKDHVEGLEKASAILKELSMQNREYYHLNQLSGGQMQRVAIARALVNDPSIILADEPTGNLDSANGKNIMELLKGLNDRNNTIIMVTHDANLAKYADRIIHMADGKITNDDRVATVKAAKPTEEDKPAPEKPKKKSKKKKKSSKKSKKKKGKK